MFGDDIYQCLQNVLDNPSNETLASELTNTINSFFSKGSGSTVDNGTVGSGIFTGSGSTTSINGDTTLCITTMSTMFNSMNPIQIESVGNSMCANAIASGISILCSNANIICSVIGEVTDTTTGVITPMGGTSKGSFAINMILLQTKLISLFTDMNVKENETTEQYEARLEIPTKYKDVNESFAYKLADIIKTIFSSGTLSTKGELTLSTVSGQGTITFTDE